MLYFDVIEWIRNYLDNMFGISILNTPQGVLNFVSSTILVLLGFFQAYKVVYLIIGIFRKHRTFTPKQEKKKYAFVIAAKNEECVIGNLIDSIFEQDYPKELIDIFVVADNCTDKTVEVLKSKKVKYFERNEPNTKLHRKGYGLEFLFNEMKNSGVDIEHDFDGYVVVDADNVLTKTYLSKMNDAFLDGYDAVTPYRNSKNVASTVWSFQSGLNWSRVNICDNRPRGFIGSSGCLTGTGFIIKSTYLKDGWKWHLLTEDSELTTDLIAADKKIMYVDEAEIYDEQPNTFKMMFRQRIRWQKGNFVVFFKKWGKLFVSFIKHPTWSKFDQLVSIFPKEFVNFTTNFLYQILSLILFLVIGSQSYNWNSFITYIITFFVGGYVSSLVLVIIYYIVDIKRLHISFPKAVLNILLFPFYDMFAFIFVYGGLFSKSKWKHIDHYDAITADQIEQENSDLQNRFAKKPKEKKK